MKLPQPGIDLAKNEWLFLILLLLAALLLRFTNIAATSLWIDELYSFMVANGRLPPEILPTTVQSAAVWAKQGIAWQHLSWPTLLEALKINVHMPLYYLLLNPWLNWFGTSTVGLRSFSAVISTLLLIPLYFLGRSIGGSRQAGFLVLLVGALAPFQIYYAQEGRMYALSMFWTAWASLALWKTLFARNFRWWGLAYAVSVIFGFFSHYMFAFVAAFHGLYVLAWLFTGSQDAPAEAVQTVAQKKARFLILGLAALLLGLALWWWWPIYRIQHQGLDEEYHFAKGLVKWHRYVSLPLWQPLVMIAGSNNWERVFYFPLMLVCWILGFFTPKFAAIKDKKPQNALLKKEAFLGAWIFIPLLLQIAYDYCNNTHISVMDRYVLVIAPAMVVWLGLALNSILAYHRSARFPVLACLLGMLIMAILNVWAPSPFRDEHNKTKDIRRQMNYIAAHAQPRDLVLVNGPWGSHLMAAYYLNISKPDQPILYWMSPYRHQQYPLPSQALLRAYDRVWLFTYRSTNERGLRQISQALTTLYPHMQVTPSWRLFSP